MQHPAACPAAPGSRCRAGWTAGSRQNKHGTGQGGWQVALLAIMEPTPHLPATAAHQNMRAKQGRAPHLSEHERGERQPRILPAAQPLNLQQRQQSRRVSARTRKLAWRAHNAEQQRWLSSPARGRQGGAARSASLQNHPHASEAALVCTRQLSALPTAHVRQPTACPRLSPLPRTHLTSIPSIARRGSSACAWSCST